MLLQIDILYVSTLNDHMNSFFFFREKLSNEKTVQQVPACFLPLCTGLLPKSSILLGYLKIRHSTLLISVLCNKIMILTALQRKTQSSFLHFAFASSVTGVLFSPPSLSSDKSVCSAALLCALRRSRHRSACGAFYRWHTDAADQ